LFVFGARAFRFAGGGSFLACLLGVMLASAPACEVPKYEFADAGVPDADSGPPPPATPTVCGTDAECAFLPSTTVCDPLSGYCVECMDGRADELGRCPAGTYCEADHRCAVGCATDSDCGDLGCDLETHRCTGCGSDVDCAPGTTCIDGSCAAGCVDDLTCPAGWACCGGNCKNLLGDSSSCGACDGACEEGGQCINGVCGPGPCETGRGECDGIAENGCETDLIANPANCGRCRAVCASGVCSGGACAASECPVGYADCNQLSDDLCETSLSTLGNCMVCGKACNDAHGVPSCTTRGCAIACETGFGDCDLDADTGCETDVRLDRENCGACGRACENENGSTRCVEGECQPSCGAGFEDCDGDPLNGCETDLGSSVRHCGACGARCNPESASGECVDGVCTAACDSGFADCNGLVEDGCEVDLASPSTCGNCETACSDNGGTPRCDEVDGCTIECDSGRADCINGAIDGCETNTNVSVLHCGACGNECPGAVGTPACNDGECGVSTCTEPFAECDADDATSCETDVTGDPENCGGCGIECFYPNATGTCVNGTCGLGDCNDGYADCNSSLGCETQLGTPSNCDACGAECTNAHGTRGCAGTPGSFVCAPVCSQGFLDCTNPADGCETDTTIGSLWAVSGRGRVFLSWPAVSAATGYVVRRATASGGPYVDVATGVAGTTFVDTGLTNGTAYYYVVAAVVSCGTGIASMQAVATPDAQLVAHYMFDETSGTSAFDASGNGRTANLSGATFVAGRRGNAVRIAGGTQRVNLPASIVQGCTDLTAATWVRLAAAPGSWARFFDFGSSTTTSLYMTPRADETDTLRFAITTSGTPGEQRLSHPYVFPTATWKHVAVVIAGNTGRLYLDAAEVAQNTAMTVNPSDLGATPNDWLGDSQWEMDPTLNGTIDDFRISCRAYGPAEITALTQ
jgi:hypothetical protein